MKAKGTGDGIELSGNIGEFKPKGSRREMRAALRPALLSGDVPDDDVR
jgi:hypothetical protein